MYYMIAKQEFDNGSIKRSIISVANGEIFSDLQDKYLNGTQDNIVMNDDTFKKITKNGYPTKEAAINDINMKRAIRDFVGPFFTIEFSTTDDKGLRDLYKKAKKNAA